MIETWKIRGLCSELPLDHSITRCYFSMSVADRRPARNFCLSGGPGGGECPVRLQCLRYALENKQIWGIWGGCDEDELRRALAVNANGQRTTRARYPQCPACHARPSWLMLVRYCPVIDAGSGVTSRERVKIECRRCKFDWRSTSSAAAVRAYWREQRGKGRLLEHSA